MNRLLLASLAFLLSIATGEANARERLDEKSDKKEVKAVLPATKEVPLPAMPKPEATAGADTNFPALPPSRPCKVEDLRGLFRLVNVYEDPAGTETTSFQTSPHQFLLFKASSIYMRANIESDNLNPKGIVEYMKEHSSGLSQYLLQENGFVYFYQDSVANDVKACFIVADNKVPFKTGQMILMPPKGQSQVRLVKLYDRIGGDSEDKQPAAVGKSADKPASGDARKSPAKKKKKK